MAEKKTKTCQGKENLSESEKNERPKTSNASNLMEEQRNSLSKLNMDKSKNNTKEETCCAKNSLLKSNIDKSKNNTKEETCCAKNSLLKSNIDKSKNNTKEEKSGGNEKTKESRTSLAKESKRNQSVGELAIKEGRLYVLRKKPRQYYFRLLPTSPGTRAQLQLYSKAENANQNGYQPEQVILAHEVNSVVPLQEPEHAFFIQYRDEILKLSAEDDFAQMSWIKAIRKVLLSENQATFTDVKIPRSFNVFISKETQKRIGDGSLVELFVEYGSIAIIASTNIRLVRWPIAQLRTFGFDAETFMVTAGRNSEHGEGVYSFITKQGEEIHRTVKAAKTKDSSFDGPLPGIGWQPPCCHESSSPPRPNNGPPNYTPFGGIYDELPMYDPIYESVGVMVQKPNKLAGSKAPTPIKSRYPTDPGSESRPVQQGRAIRSHHDPASERTPVKAATTAGNDREVVYDDVRLPWVDRSYKNIVTAFPIFPNDKVVPKEQPSADESLYASVDHSKKTNNKKDPGESLVPEHKRVTLPHDARGYTLTANTKL